MGTVTIVIPCFNAGQWLAESVESALRQTHPSTEIIVVDDGSTDSATLALLAGNPWPRTKIIRKPNGGLSSARNYGIEHASGEYILPLDADDIIAPSYCELASAALDSDPNLGIIYCRAELFGAREGEFNLPQFSIGTILTQGTIFSCAMFRKRDWQEVGGYDEGLATREDHDFWLRILGLGRSVLRLDQFLFRYRIREDSMNHSMDTELLRETYRRIVRNNRSLYSDHTDELVTAWFSLLDERNQWRNRFGRLQRWIDQHPAFYGYVRGLRRIIHSKFRS